MLVGISRAAPHRWACTIMAAIYTLFQLALVWILPLFRAEPKLGPVYYNVTHFVPPGFPLLLLAPAVALDLLRRVSSRWGVWRETLATGALFVAVFLAVQWPFADFLQSPWARNCVLRIALLRLLRAPDAGSIGNIASGRRAAPRTLRPVMPVAVALAIARQRARATPRRLAAQGQAMKRVELAVASPSSRRGGDGVGARGQPRRLLRRRRRAVSRARDGAAARGGAGDRRGLGAARRSRRRRRTRVTMVPLPAQGIGAQLSPTPDVATRDRDDAQHLRRTLVAHAGRRVAGAPRRRRRARPWRAGGAGAGAARANQDDADGARPRPPGAACGSLAFGAVSIAGCRRARCGARAGRAPTAESRRAGATRAHRRGRRVVARARRRQRLVERRSVRLRALRLQAARRCSAARRRRRARAAARRSGLAGLAHASTTSCPITATSCTSSSFARRRWIACGTCIRRRPAAARSTTRCRRWRRDTIDSTPTSCMPPAWPRPPSPRSICRRPTTRARRSRATTRPARHRRRSIRHAAPRRSTMARAWSGCATTRRPRARRAGWFRFRVEDAGGAAQPLEPYMGMMGHAAFVRRDGSTFAHVHPTGSVPMASMVALDGAASDADAMAKLHATAAGATEVAFPYGFPQRGRLPHLRAGQARRPHRDRRLRRARRVAP